MAITTRSARLSIASAALIAAGALALAGCTAPSDAGGGTAAPGPSTAPSTSPEDLCGTTPEMGINDPDGLLAGFSDDVVASYNGLQVPVRASAWADFKSEKTSGWNAAIVSTPTSAAFTAALINGLRDGLEAEGFNIVAQYEPDTNANVPLQVQQFQEALALEPDVIFFVPIAPEPAVALLEAAYEADIPVVALQTPVDSPYGVSLSNNSVLSAAELAAALFTEIGGSGEILHVTGYAGVAPTLLAEVGLNAALELCPDITVAGTVAGNFAPPAAQAAVLQYLATSPLGVDGVFQDGTMGLAILNAFLESGADPVPPIIENGAHRGFASWALQNDYPFIGSALPVATQTQRAVDVAKGILLGGGPKVNQLVWTYFQFDSESIAEYADPSWDVTDATGIPGPLDQPLPPSQLEQFFEDPSVLN